MFNLRIMDAVLLHCCKCEFGGMICTLCPVCCVGRYRYQLDKKSCRLDHWGEGEEGGGVGGRWQKTGVRGTGQRREILYTAVYKAYCSLYRELSRSRIFYTPWILLLPHSQSPLFKTLSCENPILWKPYLVETLSCGNPVLWKPYLVETHCKCPGHTFNIFVYNTIAQPWLILLLNQKYFLTEIF